MRGKSGEDATGNAAVTVGLAVAENGISFIDYDDDGAEGANGHQDAGLLALSVADPLGAEISKLHNGQATLTSEAIDQVRFANADASGKEDAAFENIIFAVPDKPCEVFEFGFGSGMSGDAIESDARLGV